MGGAAPRRQRCPRDSVALHHAGTLAAGAQRDTRGQRCRTANLSLTSLAPEARHANFAPNRMKLPGPIETAKVCTAHEPEARA